jgi:lipoprotein-anchoring transpeptidase ErfK/SrfK
MTASAAVLAGLAAPAQALPFNLQSTSQPMAAPPPDFARPAKPGGVTAPSREKTAAKEKDGAQELAPKAKGLLSVIISIDKQQLTLYSDGQPIAHSRVSTGMAGHATPTGVFSVIQKDRWHHSNLYGDAPMYFMQRITWSGVAMHQGVVPNQPASHGCIRLPEAFARQMWGITKLGMRVIIAYSEAGPVAISHPRLFTLKREPLEAKLEPKREPGESSAEVVKAAHGALDVIQFAATKRDATASDASKLKDPALDAIAYALGTARESPATSSEVRSVYDMFEPAKPRRANSVGSKSVASLETEVRPLKPGPISVFISRKEGKLFVRKGFEPVFSVPVTFEQPDQPLGTHVYTALAVQDDNTTMRWNVVSMPGAGSARKSKSEKGKPVEVAGPASTAAQALDRVTIPPEALERISDMMSPGASLIISDKGLGSETGVGTDFIVLTR